MYKYKVPKDRNFILHCEGKQYAIDSDKTILSELERYNIPVSRGCGVGICSSCKVTMISGEVQYLRQPIAFLDKHEILTCISYALSDVMIELT